MKKLSSMRRMACSALALAVSVAVLPTFAAQQAMAAPAAPKAKAQKPAATAAKRPNVLFILIDDLRPDLGIYGHPTARTPNIDALGKSGMVFENAFISQAVCGPSRAALMTGLRPDTTGIVDLETPVDKAVPNALTILDTFKRAGYRTMGYGKVYHHIDDDADGWDYRAGDAEQDMRRADIKAKKPRLGVGMVPDNQPLPDGVNVKEALAQLPKLAKSDQPFFMAVGIHRPHLPFIAPEWAWKQYTADKVPGPINPEGQKNAPPWALVSYEVWNYPDTKGLQPNMPKAKADEFRWGYLAAITYADSLVGQLTAELKKQGLDDDTIVVLWGDHGFKLGDHKAWAKHSTAGIDIRIPLIIRAPGTTRAASRTKALAETVDVYPTLAELAGLKAPADVEGLSLTPVLSKPTTPWKQAAFAQYPRNGGAKGSGPMVGYTVRTADYRYTAWVAKKDGSVVAKELYDLRKDPNEGVNVADERAYAATVKELEATRRGGWQKVRSAVTG